MKYDIKIPVEDLSEIHDIISIEDKLFDQIIDRIQSEIKYTTDLEVVENQLKSIYPNYKFVLRLYYAICGLDIIESQFIERIYDNYLAESSFTHIDKQVFISKFEKLLFQDSPIKISVKATLLKSESQHQYISSRIFTDVRPIFCNSDNNEVLTNVILHNLKIQYRANDETKEIFITFSESELRELKKIIERAELKEKTLINSIKNIV